jgi:hypothetical protein
LARDLFRSAFIEIEDVAPTASAAVPFLRNVTIDELQRRAGLGSGGSDPRFHGTRSSGAYWNVPLLLAFEGTPEADHDPTLEFASAGATVKTRDDRKQPMSAVFLETIRDLHDTETRELLRPSIGMFDHYRATVAHELLHAMGSTAHDGGIMCAMREIDQNDPRHASMTPRQEARLRSAIEPDTMDQPVTAEYCDNSQRPEDWYIVVDCCPRIVR